MKHHPLIGWTAIPDYIIIIFSTQPLLLYVNKFIDHQIQMIYNLNAAYG